MAWDKKAFARVAHKSFHPENWNNFLNQSPVIKDRRFRMASGTSLSQRAAEILGEELSLDNYLLTHTSIVASVDTYDVPNMKLGVFDGFMGKKLNRKWSNFRITPETQGWINSNCDSWDRPVLLKAYPTFIGAQNFYEHVQREELSKGRIVDAVARDIGDSVYIDILVATHRKHAELVRDIEEGRMSTLSMGCFLAGTQVTMEDGTRVAIEDVAPGDMVITHRGRSREVQNKQILNYTGDLRLINVVGIPTTIRATANHGFEVLRAPKICACGCGEKLPQTSTLTRRMKRRFKVGHDKNVYNPNNVYSLEEGRIRLQRKQELAGFTFEKVRADELEVGDFLAFPRSVSENSFEGWTKGKSRLIGYFLAEGSFLKTKGEVTEIQLSFSITEKETFVKEVVELLETEFPNGPKPWVQERPDRSLCVIHRCGRDVAEWFKQHCGEYSHAKKLSKEVISLPEEFQKELLGAWLNGDGGFGNANSTLTGTTVSYDLACQMHLLLAKCGVFSRLEIAQDGIAIDLQQAIGDGFRPNPETGKRPSFRIVMGLTSAQKLVDVCSKVGPKTSSHQQLRVTDTHLIFPITSIDSDWYEGVVYNMEVEEDHTYIVEGVAVHNCVVSDTQCTKCGNVATDEVDLCDCQKYERGQLFYDENGNQHKVAELCGNKAMDHETCGVKFIEASWVKTPAFTGAVLRNIILPSDISKETAKTAAEILSSPPKSWTSSEGKLKAAKKVPKFKLAEEFDFGEEESESKPEEKEKSPLDNLEKDVEEFVLSRVKENIHKKMQKENQEEAALTGEIEVSDNNNFLKEAKKYQTSVQTLIKVASSDAEFINNLSIINEDFGIKVGTEIYRTVLMVGSPTRFQTRTAYLTACQKFLGRNLSRKEAQNLFNLGQVLAQLQKERNL